MGHNMVGRQAELDGLSSFLTDSPVGMPGLALIAGDGGIGKTRLVETATEHCKAESTLVLAGRCADLRSGHVPFAAVADALRDGPPRVVAAALDAVTGTVTVPRARLFDLVRSAVAQLARRQHMVLLIEDLHWADDATLDCLTFLLTSATEGRWALLGTYRPEEVTTRAPLRNFLEGVSRHRPSKRLELHPLGFEDVAAMLRSLTGGTVGDARAQRIHHRSGGIPLLVEELQAADAAGLTGVPGHLRELYVSRLQGLSDTAVDLVRAAAVLGSGAEEALLLAVASVAPGDQAARALEEAMDAGCLLPEGAAWGFRHELLREAVEGTLVPARRRALHAAAATALRDARTARPAVLAQHWYAGGRHVDAAEASWLAAEEAEHLHAHAAVHQHLERVLELWDHLPDPLRAHAGDRGGVAARAAEAAFQSAAMGCCLALAEEAVGRTSHDPDVAPGWWERLGWYRLVSGDGDGAEAAYEQALASLADGTPAGVRVQTLTGCAWMYGATARPQRARPLVEQAMEVAERTGDPLQRCRAHLVASFFGEDGEADATEARDLALTADADEELARAYVRLVELKAQDGRVRDAWEAAHEGAGLARQRNLDAFWLALVGWELGQLVDLGEFQDAADLMDRAPRSVGSMAQAWCLMDGVRLAAARGESELVTTLMETIAGFIARVPRKSTPLMVARCGHIEHLLWSGEPGTALALATATRADPYSEYPHLEAALVALGVRAAGDLHADARAGGRRGEASELEGQARELLAALPDSTDPRARAWAATALAEHSRLTDSGEGSGWQDAIDAWTQLENPYQAAVARWRWAHQVAADRTQRARARELLGQAAQTARRLGAAPLLGAVEALAAQQRLSLGQTRLVPDPAIDAAQRLGLTPREMEVLALVTRGRTNKGIGEVLSISPRTVSTHVSRILRKLGAARRTEAAAMAREQGLVAD